MNNQRKKLAVLVSGTGSLLEAMIKENLMIDLVIADRHCRGINEVILGKNIKSKLIERKSYGKSFDREAYTKEVLEVLKENKIDVVAMAGFMTIFSPIMFENYKDRILNIHPSLLPLFKGDKAVEEALKSGTKETGSTVHIATDKLDDEETILAQEKVPILPADTVETLHERIKKVERVLYPKVIKDFLSKI